MKEAWKTAESFWKEKFPSGRSQPGSGNQPGAPGDIRYLQRVQFQFDEKVLLESKETMNKSLAVQEAWLAKITSEALALGRVPLFGMTVGKEQWLAIPAWAIQPTEEDPTDE